MAVHPAHEPAAPFGAAPQDAQYADLQFHEGQRGKEEARRILGRNPRRNTGVDPAVAGLAELIERLLRAATRQGILKEFSPVRYIP